MSNFSRRALLLLSLITPFLCFADFVPFTGKVLRSKVRIRLTPDLEGKVINEVPRDYLLIVTGETEEFYAVSPPAHMKAYIFRTFVLDGMVEGSRVNVRLEPNLDSPVIAQLNSGDHVEGKVCGENNKWYEIKPPATVAFYVYKDYIEKVGDANYLAQLEERRKEVNHLLSSAYMLSQEEMQKSFEEIDLDLIVSIIQELIARYPDFPEHAKRARDLLTLIQDHYLQQKADYLEFKSKEDSEEWKNKNKQLMAEMEVQRKRLNDLERQVKLEKKQEEEDVKSAPESANSWAAVEQMLYEEQGHELSFNEYYEKEKEVAKLLSGIIKPYDRMVKNKPGDYLLVNPTTQTPIAFLYSTNADLLSKVGETVTVQASPRPNHHFAFPAYFVHVVE